MRLRSLADRLEIRDASFDAIAEQAGARLHRLIVEAATGSVPDHLRDAPRDKKNPYKGHASHWFKSVDGGRELAGKVLRMGVWRAALQDRLEPFLAAVEMAQDGMGDAG